MEFGVIDSLSIQVPWTQIHTGLVNVFIDNLQVVLRLIVIDAESADGDKEDSSFTDGIKMVLLQIIMSTK